MRTRRTVLNAPSATSTGFTTTWVSTRHSGNRCTKSEKKLVTNFRSFVKKLNRDSRQSRNSLAPRCAPFLMMRSAPNTTNFGKKWTRASESASETGTKIAARIQAADSTINLFSYLWGAEQNCDLHPDVLS